MLGVLRKSGRLSKLPRKIKHVNKDRAKKCNGKEEEELQVGNVCLRLDPIIKAAFINYHIQSV